MVEEWLSAFEGMGHGGDIHLGQQIAGQVRLQVRRGRSRDGIAIGHAPPRLTEEGRRLRIVQLQQKIFRVERIFGEFVKNRDPVEIAEVRPEP